VDPRKGLSDTQVLQFSFLFLFFGVKLDLGVLGFSLSSFMLNRNVSGSKLLNFFPHFFQVAQHGRLYGTNGMPSIGPFTYFIFFLICGLLTRDIKEHGFIIK